MQRTPRESYKQFLANKTDSLGETDRFSQMHNRPRLNQEELENMSWPIVIPEIESGI